MRTRNPKPEPETRNPKPETRNPKRVPSLDSPTSTQYFFGAPQWRHRTDHHLTGRPHLSSGGGVSLEVPS